MRRDQNKHAFYNLYGFDSPVDRSYGEPTHLCWHEVYSDGTCPQKHPQGGDVCDDEKDPKMVLSDVEKHMLWDTGVMGTPSALADLVERFGEVVAYNPSRTALQVRGCQGHIIMSIPLSPAQAAAMG